MSLKCTYGFELSPVIVFDVVILETAQMRVKGNCVANGH